MATETAAAPQINPSEWTMETLAREIEFCGGSVELYANVGDYATASAFARSAWRFAIAYHAKTGRYATKFAKAVQA